MDEQAKRQIVAGCLRAAAESGMADNRVSEKFGVPLRTKGLKVNIRAGNTLDDVPESGGPRSINTLENVTVVSQAIKDNPRQSQSYQATARKCPCGARSTRI